ncbi:MAG: hypothetical protein MJ171_07990 [Clostridia bacterium]|nr:hypothetical protein [Clostridia bacterium]
MASNSHFYFALKCINYKLKWRFEKVIAIAPGETIIELIEDRCITEHEMAESLGISDKDFVHLIKGECELTYNIAVRLEAILGAPVDFWIRLEARYRENLKMDDVVTL